ncbi:MAG: hypothetical protein NTY63_05945 [Candidatus Bipolaricaulota bacterium]|nr:hypothetical protein [Candidatus Bipolaricaulota bacterium]
MKSRVLFLWAVLFLGGAVAGYGGEWFTGSWEAAIGFSPQGPQAFSSFESTLDVGIRIEFVEVSSISDFIFDGWLWQEFDVMAGIGPVCFEGEILFDPQTSSFLYAQGIFSLEFDPMVFRFYGAFTGETQSESLNYGGVFEVYGELLDGLVTFQSLTYLGATLDEITFTAAATQTDSTLLTKTFLTDPSATPPGTAFSGEQVTVTANAFDCAKLESVTLFSGTGFESEELELAVGPLFGIPLILTLDLTYETQSASYAFTPSLETDYGCLFVYTTLVSTGSVIEAMDVYGIKFQATVGGATLTSISNLDTTQYVIIRPEYGWFVESLTDAVLDGYLFYPQEYWEVLALEVQIPPFGSGFYFSVETCFSTTDGMLFEWAESTMGVTLALGQFVSMSTGISIDTDGFREWTLSFRVAW